MGKGTLDKGGQDLIFARSLLTAFLVFAAAFPSFIRERSIKVGFDAIASKMHTQTNQKPTNKKFKKKRSESTKYFLPKKRIDTGLQHKHNIHSSAPYFAPHTPTAPLSLPPFTSPGTPPTKCPHALGSVRHGCPRTVH